MAKEPVVVARAKGDTEITPVSSETEVRIPWLNYLKLGQVIMILDGIAWCIIWLLWARSWAKEIGYWNWLVDKWAPWFSLNWPWVVITLLLCWTGPSVAYAFYLVVETVAKRTPAYTPWPSEWGIWRPQLFRRFIPPGEEDEPEEMERDTVDVNLWDWVKGRQSRKRRRTLPDFLISPQARSFYRALTSHPPTASFSEREAGRFGIRRRQFRQNIRDALFEREMAGWRDDRHPNQGIDLTDDALRTMELLGRGTGALLPRRRA